MERYEIVLCDDEQDYIDRAVKVLDEFISAKTPNYKIFTYNDPKDLIKDLKEKKVVPIIVFMDIDFERMNGIKVVEELNKLIKETRIVYLTNYLKFATDVYSTEHFYYVKKGELKERLPDILEKYKQEIEDDSKFFRASLKNNKYLSIKMKDIAYFERQGRYTCIHMQDGEEYLMKDNLNSVADRLEDYFVRCHNSYIVSLNHVTEYKRDSMEVCGEEIPISRNYQVSMKERYMKYLEMSIFDQKV